jgi:hypothetical protein
VCGTLGAANDFTLVGGSKYFSPGYIFQQFNAPYQSFDSAILHGDIGTSTPPGKSGPGAGCYPGAPPTCSEGIEPGALPGVAIYPAGPQPSWPTSLKPYEYWQFWPRRHKSALNALYYDPLPHVFAAGRCGWRKFSANGRRQYEHLDFGPDRSVGADVVYVDLTLPVNLGLWCNSDWSPRRFHQYRRVPGERQRRGGVQHRPRGRDGLDYTYLRRSATP